MQAALRMAGGLRQRLHTSAAAANAFRFADTGFPAVPYFEIIDTTLREGEQFSSTDFTSHDRVYIAKLLDTFGVDYIELVNPFASHQAREDCRAIANLGLKAKIVAHTRCHMDDVRACVETGIDGVSMYMATSEALRRHSHGKSVQAVIDSAREVIEFVKDNGMEVRFSCEDTFRSDRTELLDIYAAIDELGVNRVGLADTVGIATPFQVAETVAAVRSIIKPETGIEFHTHNDTGCCIANALVALQAGATHINTCVLGVGERNGITPLGGFLARMYTLDRESVKNKYDLKLLRHLEKYVAAAAKVQIPFNNYITGSSAFTHKAGVHSKAVMSDPGAYEVINPDDFGVGRNIEIAHHLTGWNALKARSMDLNLTIPDDQIKAATKMVKHYAADKGIKPSQLDQLLIGIGRVAASNSSSDFVKMAALQPTPELKTAMESAAHALLEYENKVALDILATIAEVSQDARPTKLISVSGHLFDKAVLNRLLDLVVDSPCDFEVKRLHVPPADEQYSTAVLQLWGENDATLDQVKSDMQQLIDANSSIAFCTLEEISFIEDPAAMSKIEK
ncbi:uncharacterized protein MONBRDRAFT_34312 [Monosiga brevicollis MX1]|uniref:homocitrate synthase n=1 Tax=Monosiga brevicollis TaxID=81824 RepID=A9VAW1_MONBE|nr:uncharacterized protein MONBRDRAFT_34312 [Monosiga brevicollis MX1]EDQ85285.1 predicted protein [Monosiga brevicollis MX1]|eukprot:XP_001749906.1 hypothetical protein [Monosiga brevicollis MX1]